jgi:hypothetical protein
VTRVTKILLIAALIAVGPDSSFTQEFRGTLTGRVTDQSDAVIPTAKVVAQQVETGSKHETVSSALGVYTLPFLPPGTYSVTVEAPGFKKFVRTGIRVQTNERAALDIGLELGNATETITVSAEVPLLQASTASTGQVINPRQIENMR